MKNQFRLLASVCGLALLASPALAVSAHTTLDAKFQIGPGTKYAVVGTIPAGARLDVIWCGTTDQWCLVDIQHRLGWVLLSGLKFASAQQAAMVIEDGKGNGPSGPSGKSPVMLAGNGAAIATLAGGSTIDTDPPKSSPHVQAGAALGGLHLGIGNGQESAKMP